MKKNWLGGFFFCMIIFVVPLFCYGISYAGEEITNDSTKAIVNSTIESESANNNYLGISISGSKPMRGFVNSDNVNFGPIPSFFGPDTPGPTYQKVELILPLKSEWKRYELDVSISETEIMFRCRYFLKTRKTLIKELEKEPESFKSDLEEKPGDTIHIITVPPKGEFKMIGHITLWAKDKYTTSFELMGKACLLAMELPTAKSVLIMSQGCEKKVETSGWGIGVNHTTATISDSQSSGTVNSGGTGYSSGEAGNTGRPWLQVAVIQ